MCIRDRHLHSALGERQGRQRAASALGRRSQQAPGASARNTNVWTRATGQSANRIERLRTYREALRSASADESQHFCARPRQHSGPVGQDAAFGPPLWRVRPHAVGH
eukprot:6304142-Alexandrium_andersonii.AAC.1